MKLRNKKTGGIVEYDCFYFHKVNSSGHEDFEPNTKTLAELNEEWEDYEDPKDVWWVDNEGFVNPGFDGDDFENNKRIGNYFKTKEEAEKAVEKLKAWKRLKDTGCKPITWRWKHDYPNDACYAEVVLKCQFDSGVYDRELDLLFGGEE